MKKEEIEQGQWEQIKTEYITSEISYRALAKKYGISFSCLQSRGKAENWVGLREECRDKIVQKSVDLISDEQANRIARALRIGDKILDRIEEALDDIDKLLVKKTTTVKRIGKDEDDNPVEITRSSDDVELREVKVDTLALKQIASTLRDLKEIKVFTAELDKQEQEARIRKLQKDVQDDGANDIKVVMDSDLDEYGV